MPVPEGGVAARPSGGPSVLDRPVGLKLAHGAAAPPSARLGAMTASEVGPRSGAGHGVVGGALARLVGDLAAGLHRVRAAAQTTRADAPPASPRDDLDVGGLAHRGPRSVVPVARPAIVPPVRTRARTSRSGRRTR